MEEIYNFNFIIHEASYTTVDKEWERVVAVYPYYRIYYVTDGFAEIFFKQGSIVLEPGYLYFLPAFTVVRSYLYKKMTHYYMHFIQEDAFSPNNLLNSFKFKQKIKADEMVESVFKKAMAHRFGETTKDKLVLDSSLKYFLSQLIDEKIERNYPQWVEEIINYTKEHIYEGLTVNQLAEIAGYDRTYFSVIFKKHFKQSPKQYILNEKIKAAQLLFTNEKMSISDIAEKLSFLSGMYFSRIFKKKTGLTPSDYKRKLSNS